MAFEDNRVTKTSTPYNTLLLYSCMGCHSNVSDGSTIINNTPIVYNSGGPTTPLAGGNFFYIASADNNGHNVKALGNADSLGSPPGDENTTNITTTGNYASTDLTCAGLYGCHGDRETSGDLAAIKGAHHSGVSGVCDGSDLANSYRFLNGVKGHENMDATYKYQNYDSQYHNEYYGASGTGTQGDASTPGGDTISGFCAECHGDFHQGTDVTAQYPVKSPWLRHPTDIVLTNSGEYTAYTTYSIVAPIARSTVYGTINTADPNAVVTPGTDIIMCLSCHGAHATPNYKLMRWDYANSLLSTALAGCAVCHTTKN